jgi:hypothetical protein
MTTDPDRIDAYIAKKGLVPLVSDAQWELVLQRIAALFGRELWHRCRLVHQADDIWGRYSTEFPDAVPKPYRHIRHLELCAGDSPQLQELTDWLTESGVPWRVCRQRDVETGQDEVVGLKVFGYVSGYGPDVAE